MELNKETALFVKTQDLKTAEGLTAAGFQLLDYSNDTWIFMNNPNYPLTFDNNRMAYSNILTF